MTFDKLIHKNLGVPYTLHVARDRKVKNELATVIFLHGIASDSGVWRDTLKEIAAEEKLDGLRLIAIDLLGFGKSPAPEWGEYREDDFLRAMRKTLRKNKVKYPVILVGHSMGGLLAINYTARYGKDVHSLVLISPPLLKRTEINNDVINNFYIKFFEKLKGISGKKPTLVAGRAIEKVSSFRSKHLSSRTFSMPLENIILSGKSWGRATRLKNETIIIHGKLDPLVSGKNLRCLAGQNKMVALHEIAVAGHDVVGAKRKKIVTVLKEVVRGF